MLKCLVEMYGLPGKTTERPGVEIRLKERAGLADVIAALRREVPSLEGEAIRSGEDRLADGYILNINGKLYADYGEIQGDGVLSLKDGDRIALLPLSSGG